MNATQPAMTSSPTTAPPVLARALIVDDHPLFCDALALTLRALAGVGSVETAAELGAAVERIEAGPMPDLVLLDLDLPDVEGLEGLLRLRATAPGLPVLVVSSMADTRLIHAALAAGAVGFVPKHSGRDAFRDALAAVAEGRCYLPEGFGPAGQDEDEIGEAIERLARLTRQQARILELLCQGKLNKQIAWELSIAETTVKAHVTAIMRKLGVQSRTQAVLLAHQARFSNLMPEG